MRDNQTVNTTEVSVDRDWKIRRNLASQAAAIGLQLPLDTALWLTSPSKGLTGQQAKRKGKVHHQGSFEY